MKRNLFKAAANYRAFTGLCLYFWLIRFVSFRFISLSSLVDLKNNPKFQSTAKILCSRRFCRIFCYVLFQFSAAFPPHSHRMGRLSNLWAAILSCASDTHYNPNVSRFRLAHLLDYSKSFSPFNRFLIFQVFSHLKTINSKLNGFLLGGPELYVSDEKQRMFEWFDISIEKRPFHFANDDQK